MSQPPASPMPQYGGPMSTPPSSPMPPPPPPKKKRTGLIIGIIAGALFLIVAVIVVIALIIFFAVRNGGGGDTTDGGGGGDKAATPEEQATTLVTDYMDALVAGDSAAAFELAADPSGSDEVLPAAAYDAALAAAPIADVVVGAPAMEPEGIDGTVPVSFTVGGEATTYDFTVSDYDSDESLRAGFPHRGPPTHRIPWPGSVPRSTAPSCPPIPAPASRCFRAPTRSPSGWRASPPRSPIRWCTPTTTPTSSGPRRR